MFEWRAVFLFEFKGEAKHFSLKKPPGFVFNLKIQNQYLQVKLGIELYGYGDLIPLWDHARLKNMRIISRKQLKDFWKYHPQAERPLRAWYADAKQANWTSPTAIKKIYRNASIVANNRVVFNIKGNDYRLVVAVNYHYSVLYIRFVGTHVEYDKIDVTTI